MSPADVLGGLLALIEAAAERGTAKALAAHAAPYVSAPAPLIDKRELGRLLGKSPASIDRMCAASAIPFVVVGDVRRFDVAAVLAALEAVPAKPVERPKPAPVSTAAAGGVRLLTRRSAR